MDHLLFEFFCLFFFKQRVKSLASCILGSFLPLSSLCGPCFLAYLWGESHSGQSWLWTSNCASSACEKLRYEEYAHLSGSYGLCYNIKLVFLLQIILKEWPLEACVINGQQQSLQLRLLGWPQMHWQSFQKGSESICLRTSINSPGCSWMMTFNNHSRFFFPLIGFGYALAVHSISTWIWGPRFEVLKTSYHFKKETMLTNVN